MQLPAYVYFGRPALFEYFFQDVFLQSYMYTSFLPSFFEITKFVPFM
jgi:hypothetical protein